MLLIRSHLVVAILVGSYIGLVLLVPISQSTPIMDEPIFAQSAFDLAAGGPLRISDLSAPNAVFDTVWGAGFSAVLGPTYFALRLSTVLLTALSAPFVYVLCRSLGSGERAALLGTAAYLFAPLAISIGFTFHTDPHATALMTMAMTSFVVSILKPSLPWLVAASLFVALAFLSRPQALVVVVAGVIVLASRRSSTLRLRNVFVFGAIPSVTFVAHALWTLAAGEPYLRQLSRVAFFDRAPSDIAVLTAHAAVIEPVYIGLFALPLLPILLPRSFRIKKTPRLTSVAIVSFVGAAAFFALLQRRLVLDTQAWLNAGGFGGVDSAILGRRPRTVPIAGWLIVELGASAACIAAYFAALRSRRRSPEPTTFLALCLVGVGVAGLLSSIALQQGVFDRYLLPLAPIVIALAVSGGVVTRNRSWISLALVVVLGAIAAAGVVDAFDVYATANALADRQVAGEVSETDIDGGASWSAATFGVADDQIQVSINRVGPWWLKFYAADSRPRLGIALEAPPNMTIVDRTSVWSRLHQSRLNIFVIKSAPGEEFYQAWLEGQSMTGKS